MLVIVTLLLNPLLLVSLFVALGLDRLVPTNAPIWSPASNQALHLSLLSVTSLVVLLILLGLAVRTFRKSFLGELPLLRLLANMGPKGDLGRPRFRPREQTIDSARVLSRELVDAWYERRDTLPELIVTATNISLGKACLFTLVRPETYHWLIDRDWMAVQLDCQNEQASPYRENDGGLLTLPENFLHCILISAALPAAFPAQQLGIYGGKGGKDVRHYLVDGGALNSPVHVAIDAGATHVISLELEPLGSTDALGVDDRGESYNLLREGITTFSTLLGLSTQGDIHRTIAWNRFLIQHPEALKEESFKFRSPEPVSGLRKGKRVVPLSRIAPRKREIGTVDFNGMACSEPHCERLALSPS